MITFEKYTYPIDQKLDNFEKYVRRQSLSRFLARYELFKMQRNVKGCILECGVHHGGGLMCWAKLSAALEPLALDRRIFGFDTFKGFPSLDIKDSPEGKNNQSQAGGFALNYDILANLNDCIVDFDENRFLNQYKKIFLIEGDANETIPRFVEENPYILISLLFLDFDLYEPTKTALKHFVPRIPKGGIIAFDELNNPWWPGETLALLEQFDISQRRISRFPFDPNVSYVVI